MRGWFGEETVRIAEYFKIVREKDEVVLLEDQSSMYGSRYQEILSEGGVLLPVIRARPVDRRVCKWQKISGCEVLEETDFPASFIPVIPVIGTELWVDGKRQLSGIVRACKDPQRGLNYHASVATEVMALQPRAPFIGAAGQFEGHPEWDTANSENYSKLEYEPISSGGTLCPPPQRQQLSGAPNGMLQMMQMFAENISMASGMHEASLGAPSNETSRVAIEARNQKGDIGTSHYRGNLGFSMRHAARILLEMFPREYDTARIARIIGEDGAADTVQLDPALPRASQQTPKGQPNRHNITIGRYDVSVDTGPAYATRRQDAAAGMTEMVRAFPPMMQTHGDIMFRQMDWPGADQMADRSKKALPAELADDEEGGEPQIPPQLKVQIQQGMQQYEQQLAQAQQMIQGLQQQLGEASAAAQEGQAAAKDKGADHALKSQELQLKAFEAETRRLETQAKLSQQSQGIEARCQDVERKAEALAELIETQKQQLGSCQPSGDGADPQGPVDADPGLGATSAAIAQGMEQLALAVAELRSAKTIRVVRDETGAMVGAEVAGQEGQIAEALPALIGRQIEMALPALIEMAVPSIIGRIQSNQEQMQALEAKVAAPKQIEVIRGPDGRVVGAALRDPSSGASSG